MRKLGFPIQILGILFLFYCTGHSLRFDLKSGRTKCISEDINVNSMVVGTYHIVKSEEGQMHPESAKISVRLSSPYGNNIHSSDTVDSGTFAFTAPEAGDYTTCFFLPEYHIQTTVNIEFEWKTGISAKDWTKIAKREHIDTVEVGLSRLEETVRFIHDEMFYLRSREEEMQKINRSTSAEMAVFSIVSFFICLSVAGIQLWHLKQFFEKKKLI